MPGPSEPIVFSKTKQLHIVTGAAGVGKSTFGKTLAAKHAAVLLDSDTVTEPVVRAGLLAAGLDATDRDSPNYKRIFRDAVYQCLFDTCLDNIDHVSVVIVGPFTKEIGHADWPSQLQQSLGVAPTIWYLFCDDQIRRNRILQRANPRDQLKLDDWHCHTQNAPVLRPAFAANEIDTGVQQITEL